MGGSSSSLCEPTPQYKLVVEQDAVFDVYTALFVVSYLVVSAACLRALYDFFKEQHWKISFANNRLQVILCLAIGSLVRAVSFIPSNCVVEEVLNFLKDFCFLTAFLLIILFWVELQQYVRQMQSIKALRKPLLAMIASYSVVRLMVLVFKLADVKTAALLFQGLSICIYLATGAIGVTYGRKLLMKMKSMKKSNLQASFKKRLRKLTYFILLEVLIYNVFLVSWGIRQTQSKLKKDIPDGAFTWFYLKWWEKMLELLAQSVLCLTMTTKGQSKDEKAHNQQKRRIRQSTTPAALKLHERRMKDTGVASGRGAAKEGAGSPPAEVATSSGASSTSMMNPLVKASPDDPSKGKHLAANGARSSGSTSSARSLGSEGKGADSEV